MEGGQQGRIQESSLAPGSGRRLGSDRGAYGWRPDGDASSEPRALDTWNAVRIACTQPLQRRKAVS